MRINEIITEAVGGNWLYHGVRDGKIASAILNSGKIRPSEPFDFDREMGETRNVVSLTRDQYLRFPYGDAVVQFVIDKDALKRAGIIAEPKVGAGYFKGESEERVYKSIPVKPPYVVGIQYDPKLKIPASFTKKAEALGIEVGPWKTVNPVKSVSDKPKEIPKINPKFADPSKLEVTGNGYITGTTKVEPTAWSLCYRTSPTTWTCINPYRDIEDKKVVDDAYKKIKARIEAGLSFDDLLPKEIYDKNWKQGTYQTGIEKI